MREILGFCVNRIARMSPEVGVWRMSDELEGEGDGKRRMGVQRKGFSGKAK